MPSTISASIQQDYRGLVSSRPACYAMWLCLCRAVQ